MFEITRADAISALVVDESAVSAIPLRKVPLRIQFRCRSCEKCSLLPMFRHTLLETTRADAASVCGSGTAMKSPVRTRLLHCRCQTARNLRFEAAIELVTDAAVDFECEPFVICGSRLQSSYASMLPWFSSEFKEQSDRFCQAIDEATKFRVRTNGSNLLTIRTRSGRGSDPADPRRHSTGI